jgi:hypothetical protein
MPKFLRIGVHQSNVSGYTSKAWCVRRVGAMVFLKWGAVEVHGVADARKVYWTLPPRDKTIRCGTVQRAKDYAKAAIARRRNHRYELLRQYRDPAPNRRAGCRARTGARHDPLCRYCPLHRKGRAARRCALDAGDEPLLRRGSP